MLRRKFELFLSHFCILYLIPLTIRNSHVFSSSDVRRGLDVKWCHVSRITTPWHAKKPFHWISMKRRLVRAASEISKFQNWSHLTNSHRRYMAEILPIRRKTLSNQSINRDRPEHCIYSAFSHASHVTFQKCSSWQLPVSY